MIDLLLFFSFFLVIFFFFLYKATFFAFYSCKKLIFIKMTNRHDIAEILLKLKVVLNTIIPQNDQY